ncbi:ureidoglycolate lyase [Corallococcus llansteffanensis]|uniref:Ureidoglycolate hydrolase n=1 Tax=Corallococcus llansteffanensis TaxID=2316731 RepID=A0A3A8PZU1_9BACT|nr:ureidoglycolate lyase [Corallococcus llansteffanensis]RKH60310.1 ureidoglycolate hydrolase [Corallococcus llansteffanensis]
MKDAPSPPRSLLARPLTPESFAPFGDVVSAGLKSGAAANQGTAVRFDWSAKLESDRAGAKPNLAVFRSVPQPLPFAVKLLEHHPRSSQAFLPMRCSRFLVCVAPTDASGGPDLDGLVAFVCGPGQGVNYHRGVWHHPIIALDTPAEFAMLAWEDGGAEDCVVRQFSTTVSVHLGD